MPSSELRLNTTVQAVELRCDLGERNVRAIVARSVFEDRFGASAESASWIAAYEAHWTEVHEAIRRKADAEPEAHVVVLLEKDFPVDGRATA